MAEHRSSPRLRSVLKAEIRYNDGLMSTPCLVRDISETGARIELPSEVSLPDRFNLHIEKGNQTRPAVVERRHGKELGVRFVREEPEGSSDNEDRLARLEREVAALSGAIKRLAAASTSSE